MTASTLQDAESQTEPDAVPDAVTADIHVVLRPAVADDAPFVRSLADSTRAAEFAVLDLPAPALQQLLDLQDRAQRAQYAATHPDATDQIISVAGQAVGRVLVDEHAAGIDLVDIAVAPDSRGRGIGTAVLLQLIRRSEHTALPISLHVLDTNPARRLYERLGWDPVGFDGMRHALTRHPARKEPV